ncbi:hypothetical protein FF38_06769 [Lucilia cuprina]|uniref:Uncharacterized protein n=1 Tax=Lucilia cuprina TaxID=7375 RepID=A0A0L0CR19_LUCCU|nr:hypothetical protein FF38_06769 [Lucilia cuprina]
MINDFNFYINFSGTVVTLKPPLKQQLMNNNRLRFICVNENYKSNKEIDMIKSSPALIAIFQKLEIYDICSFFTRSFTNLTAALEITIRNRTPFPNKVVGSVENVTLLQLLLFIRNLQHIWSFNFMILYGIYDNIVLLHYFMLLFHKENMIFSCYLALTLMFILKWVDGYIVDRQTDDFKVVLINIKRLREMDG